MRFRFAKALGIFLAITTLVSQILASNEPVDDKGTVNLPRFLGNSHSVNVNKSFGSLNESIPLVLPPGRRGVEPKLELQYSSLGGYGPTGLGWNLNTGSIEVSRKFGFPSTHAVTYSVSMPGISGELVDTGNGVYRLQQESVYREFRQVNGHWEMRDGEGDIYRFGTTADSRVEGQVWFMDLLTDASGNSITYQYASYSNSPRLEAIFYTGLHKPDDPALPSGAGLGQHAVYFDYTDGPRRVSFRYGKQQELGNKTLLTRIRVENWPPSDSPAGVPDYTFQYTTDPLNGQYLLSSVRYGTIPVRSFQFQSRAAGWEAAGSAVTFPEGRPINTLKDRVVDVDGDGISDLIRVPAGSTSAVVYKGTSTGWFESPAWTNWINPLGIIGNYFYRDPDNFRLVDVNGDHLVDIVYANFDVLANPPLLYEGVWLNTGDPGDPVGGRYKSDSYSNSLINDLPPGFFASKGAQLVDVNGDNLPDIVWSRPDGDGFVYLNTGSGWKQDATLSGAIRQFEFKTGVDLIDVNGYGLADIMDSNIQRIYLNNGSNWVNSPGQPYSQPFSEQMATVDSTGNWRGVVPGDFNDDGLVDFLLAVHYSASTDSGQFYPEATYRNAFRNTGTGWVEWPEMTAELNAKNVLFTDHAPNSSVARSTGDLLADMDGNGVPDIVTARDIPGIVHKASGIKSGFISKVTTATGEVTDITWLSQRKSPSALVGTISRSNGRSPPFVETYDYFGGGMYVENRFRGFFAVNEDLPNSRRISTTYYQGEGLVGQILSEVQSDPSSSSVSTSFTNNYSVVSLQNGVQQIRLAQTTQTREDGIPTSVTQTYDSFLNVVTAVKDPDTSVAGDELTTQTSYGVTGFWNLPTQAKVLDAGGTLLSQHDITYDSTGRAVVITDRASPNGSPLTRSVQYDQYGNLTKLTDRAGNATLFGFDPTGTYRTSATDAEGRTVSSTHDSKFGVVLSETDASGNVRSYEYDSFGRMTKIALPGDESSALGTRSYVHSAYGDASAQNIKVRGTETPGSSETLDSTMFFDGMGLVYRQQREGPGADSIELITQFDYDGNVEKASRPYFPATEQPKYTNFTRDVYGRPVAISEPDGFQTTVTYSTGGRSDVTDRRGTTTTFFWNSYGKARQINQSVNGQDLITKYEYDPMTQKVSAIVNAQGNRTAMTFDMMGRQLTFTDPTTGTVSYEYDAEGRTLTMTQPGGVVTHFTYDRTGNMLQKQLPAGTIYYTLGTSASATPNAVGRVVGMQDAGGTLAVKYDGVGRVIERRRTVLGSTYVTGYAYDSLGRLRQLTYPDGFQAIYQYDKAGEASAVVDNHGNNIAVNLQRNAAGRLTNIAYGNNAVSTFQYDDLQRMTSISTQSGAVSVQNLAYTFDAGGNVLGMADSAFHADQAFQYDELNRITSASGPYGNEKYAYDLIGNMIRHGDFFLKPDPNRPEQILCGVQKRLAPGQSGPADPCASAQAFNFEYDSRGNETRRPGYQYEYDADNRLITVKDSRGLVIERNVYDAEGKQLIQYTYSPSSDIRIFIDRIFEITKSQAVRHVDLGGMRLATIVAPANSIKLISEAPPAPWSAPRFSLGEKLLALLAISILLAALSGGTVLARRNGLAPVLAYVTRPIRVAADGIGGRIGLRPVHACMIALLVPSILCVDVPSTYGQAPAPPAPEDRYYYHSNHIGSVTAITKQDGGIVERREYRPYGLPFIWTAGTDSNLANSFGGHRLDSAAGLYNFGGRYYDPIVGRFLTPDTVLPDSGNPQTLHRYALSLDNPVRYSDPTGHSILDLIIGAIVVIVIVVIVVATFGAAAGLLVAALAVAGAVGFGIWAGVRGARGESLARAIIVGAVLGAILGAGLVAAPYTLMETGPMFSWVVEIVMGVVLGAEQNLVGQLLAGAGPEDLLDSVLIEFATDVAVGAVLGGIGGRPTAATRFQGGGLKNLLKYNFRSLKSGTITILKHGYRLVGWGVQGTQHEGTLSFVLQTVLPEKNEPSDDVAPVSFHLCEAFNCSF